MSVISDAEIENPCSDMLCEVSTCVVTFKPQGFIYTNYTTLLLKSMLKFSKARNKVQLLVYWNFNLP